MTDPAPLIGLITQWRKKLDAHDKWTRGQPMVMALSQDDVGQLSVCLEEVEAALAGAGGPVIGKQCPDGFHHSATNGYGHQRCVRCGLEWEFHAAADTCARVTGQPCDKNPDGRQT